jgi:hypothetical protein
LEPGVMNILIKDAPSWIDPKTGLVKVALEVVKQPAMLDVLELDKMIRKLVDFIRNSNDL